ncbi:unnamed protein product [Ceutorhynchus assimilis]|uniref:Uncharacterized protein n=1 Tax=Ceutorhynchus assimilis TaxID=467358 RepID=A0A9N9QSK3_9CUCU|nr:unnamed protein product [Ceutorhynchus assimilis]
MRLFGVVLFLLIAALFLGEVQPSPHTESNPSAIEPSIMSRDFSSQTFMAQFVKSFESPLDKWFSWLTRLLSMLSTFLRPK